MKRVAVFIFVSALFGISLPLLHRFAVRSDIFSLQTIQTRHLERVTQIEIENYLKPFLNQSLYSISLQDVLLKLEQHPWIKSAVVRRQPPHTLEVDVTERVPVAILKLNRDYILDEDGEIIGFDTAFLQIPPTDLPVVTGITRTDYLHAKERISAKIKESVAAIKDHEKAKKPGGEIAEIRLEALEGVTILLKNQMEVFLGNDNFYEKWKQLDRIVKALPEKSQSLAFLYLGGDTSWTKVPVRFRQQTDS